MNQEIKCDVDSCKYNENAQHCSLNNIKVSSTASHDAHEKCDTGCMSFES